MPEPKELAIPRWARRAGLGAEEYARWLGVGQTKSVSVRAINATDLGLDLNKMPAGGGTSSGADDEAFPGPRLRFAWLVGESPTWSGPDSLVLRWDEGREVCRFCFHIETMPDSAYCLGCDRCGRSHLIGTPKVRAARKSYAPDPALRGGTG